jgi:hypothetical protein
MKSLTKYLQEAVDLKNSNLNQTQYQRRQELALITENTKAGRYAIQIIIQSTEMLLVEHEVYNKFSKTNNLWRRDPEDMKIPVQGHYHIVASKSKKEIYAVNMDGTAHHRRNKGYEVPKKEADELRKFGVQIPANRIIECVDLVINEELENQSVSFVIVIEG